MPHWDGTKYQAVVQTHNWIKVNVTTKASTTYLTIPENSNISARMYERYPIVKTIMGSNTARKNEAEEKNLAWEATSALGKVWSVISCPRQMGYKQVLTMNMFREASDEGSYHSNNKSNNHTGQHNHYKLCYPQKHLKCSMQYGTGIYVCSES